MAERDFGRCRVVMTQGGGKRHSGPLSREDLRGETGTLPPLDILPNAGAGDRSPFSPARKRTYTLENFLVSP